jgi:UDP:flavonoid glycosyltransferase YjiC (YdhE family)
MRVTIITIGSRGDVEPYIALGAGLRRAGHDVRLATHERFAGLADGLGLEMAPVAEGDLSRGTETEAGRRWIMRDSRLLPGWVGLLKDAASVAERRLADCRAAAEDADVLVVSVLATLLGRQLSDWLGIPLVRAYPAPPARSEMCLRARWRGSRRGRGLTGRGRRYSGRTRCRCVSRSAPLIGGAYPCCTGSARRSYRTSRRRRTNREAAAPSRKDKPRQSCRE